MEAVSSTTRMRILHLTAPARVGGLERVVAGLAVGHSTNGHHVHVGIALTHDCAQHPFVDQFLGTKVRSHIAVFGARAYVRERRWLGSLIERVRPDVVHTHGYRSDLLGGWAGQRLDVPIVSTVHGFVGGDMRARFYEWLQCRAFRRFDAVAPVAETQVGRLRGAGVPESRIHLVPNAWIGERSALSRSEAREDLGLSDSTFHVGWVGRLSREKGADILLRALSLLTGLPIRVSFLGDGTERAALEQLAHELGVYDSVRWLGFAPDARHFYPALDAYVLSSRTEGTPLVLLEAIAAGIPVIASRVGGVPSVTGEESALLVPADDAVALASAIREVAANPKVAHRRATIATQRLRDRFSPDAWLERYEGIYHGVKRP